MRVSIRIALLLCALPFVSACTGPRSPLPTERRPLDPRRPAPAPLPDDAERTAADLAGFVLARLPDSAGAALQELQLEDERRRSEGEPPTPLVDNSRDLLHTLAGPRGYREKTRQMLAEDTPIDPALRRRLETFLEQDLLVIADRRLAEDRSRKRAVVVNRAAALLGRVASGGELNPVETGRAALATLLVLRTMPDVTPQERQALHAYQEFLERSPNSPDAERVLVLVEEYQQKWLRHLHEEAMEAARKAIDAGRPDVALAHLDRADRLWPDDPKSDELRRRSTEAWGLRRARISRALSVSPPPGEPGEAEALLAARLLEDGGHALEKLGAPEGALADEARFIAALESRHSRDEDLFFDQLEELARVDSHESNMARHAAWILLDPEQDPYPHYRAAIRADRRDRLSFVLLGRARRGPRNQGLPRALEWVLDAPGLVISVATFPIRAINYPSVRKRFGGGVVHAGERYLRHFPDGEHSDEVHEKLEGLFATRGRWNRALEHHRAGNDPDPETIAEYRGKVAEQSLAAARLARRWDIRALLYREILTRYGDTPQAETARTELALLLTETTPQGIRLSREFLIENPNIWGPGALAVHRDLLDDDEDNGEIAEDGVTLIGQTYVRISLVDQEPVVATLSEESFARLAALLMETEYRQLVTDERERPRLDPQRDVFFERARLGLLDRPDARPTARSEAEFLSTKEKHGFIRRRESILPVELVVRGDIEDFGLAAFPRLRPPAESSDAWLYR